MKTNNQKGQMTTEMVLMLIVVVSTIFVVSSKFRENELFAKMVHQPWESLAGLIQNGNWGTPEKTMFQHPSVWQGNARITTPQGKVVKKR